MSDHEHDWTCHDLADCNPAPPEREILLDLIAELRSQWEAFTAADGHKSLRMKGDGWVDAARNRAEARLREVHGDE